jgi:hypothetical protein
MFSCEVELKTGKIVQTLGQIECTLGELVHSGRLERSLTNAHSLSVITS